MRVHLLSDRDPRDPRYRRAIGRADEARAELARAVRAWEDRDGA